MTSLKQNRGASSDPRRPRRRRAGDSETSGAPLAALSIIMGLSNNRRSTRNWEPAGSYKGGVSAFGYSEEKKLDPKAQAILYKNYKAPSPKDNADKRSNKQKSTVDFNYGEMGDKDLGNIGRQVFLNVTKVSPKLQQMDERIAAAKKKAERIRLGQFGSVKEAY